MSTPLAQCFPILAVWNRDEFHGAEASGGESSTLNLATAASLS
jgi:hypothetical protein